MSRNVSLRSWISRGKANQGGGRAKLEHLALSRVTAGQSASEGPTPRRTGLAVVAALALLVGGLMPLAADAAAPVVESTAVLPAQATDAAARAVGSAAVLPVVQTDVAARAVGSAAALPAAVAATSGPPQTIWAWGSNSYGLLGIGSPDGWSTVPIQVTGLPMFTDVVADYSSSFGLDTDGNVWAWGSNVFGQLGIGSADYDNHDPALVAGLPEVSSIVPGYGTVLALDADGNVWAWGRNYHGQLGIGSEDDSYVPVRVAGPTNVTSITVSRTRSVFALDADGNVWAWGENERGALGIGTDANGLIPVRVTGLANVVSITAGSISTYALDADGNIWVWGYNGQGQLGNNSTADSLVPVKLTRFANVTEMATAEFSVYALDAAGNVWAWGSGSAGRLGLGTTANVLVPTRITGLSDVTRIASATASVYALDADGDVWAWGHNAYGQLGTGDTSRSLVPVKVAGLPRIASVGVNVLSTNSVYVVGVDGSVWAWGYNRSGQLGNGDTTNNPTPTQVAGLSDVAKLVIGDACVFAVMWLPEFSVDVSVSGGGGFGSMVVGGVVPGARIVSVANTGNQPTGPLSVGLSGSGGLAFGVSGSGLVSVGVGGVVMFSVEPVAGLAVGSYTAVLTVSGGHRIRQSVPLSFEVTALPVYSVGVVVSGGGDLGSMVVGGRVPRAVGVVVSNTGDQPTGPLSVGLSGGLAFSVSESSLGSIGVGGQGTFTVAAKSGLGVGFYSATLMVSGLNGVSEVVSLSFEVTAAPVYSVGVVVAGGGGFGSMVVGGSVPLARTVTVSNRGDQPTGVLSVGLSGVGGSGFVVSDSVLGSIGVGGQGSFTVGPAAGLMVGSYSAVLMVSGGNGVSESVVLSFEVTPVPVFSVGVTVAGGGDFGSMVVGGGVSSERIVTVVNAGNQVTGELVVGLSGGGVSAFSVSDTVLGSVGVGGQVMFSVVPVSGLGVGSYTASLTVSGSHGISETVLLSLVVAPVPVFGVGVVVAGGGDFGSVVAGGGVPGARTVTVSNTGDQPTGVLSVDVSGVGGFGFGVSAAGLGSIGVGGRSTFTVVPESGLPVGSYSARLTVSGANGISQFVVLSFEVTAVPVWSVDVSVSGGGDLGSMMVGGVVPPERVVTVSNTGNRPTGVLSVGLSGGDVTAFRVSDTTLVSIGVGLRDKFTVAPVSGLSVGSYTAALTVSGSNGISRTVLLSFEVTTVPTYSVGLMVPGGGVLGSMVVGSVPLERIVTVTNTGNQPTGALSVGLSGVEASAFTVSTKDLVSVGVGGQVMFSVAPATGLSVGSYSASLTVSGSHGVNRVVSLSLTVTDPPVYSVDVGLPGGGDLGSMVTGGGVPGPVTVTVANSGDQPTGALLVGLSSTLAFTVSLAGLASIPVGGRSTLTVAAKTGLPVGVYSAALTVSGSNGVSQTVPLTFEVLSAPTYGVGVAISGGGDFGAVTSAGPVPSARMVSVTNTGNQVSGGLTVALSGGGASAFTVSAAGLPSVGVGGLTTFTVQPKSGLPVGVYTETLTVAGSHGISQTIPVCFEVTEVPVYTVDVTVAGGGDYGSITVGGNEPATRIVTVTNTGNQPSGTLTVDLSGHDATKFKTSTANVASIGVGGQTMFTLTPESGLPIGKYTAQLALSGPHGNSQPVTLTFEVTQVADYAVAVTMKSGGDFGSITTGGTVPTDRVVTVTNTGANPTDALNVALAGSGAAGFTASTTTLTSIPVADQATLTIALAADLPVGVYAAKLTVSGAHGINQTVPLTFEVKPNPTTPPSPSPSSSPSGSPSNTPSGSPSGNPTGVPTGSPTIPLTPPPPGSSPASSTGPSGDWSGNAGTGRPGDGATNAPTLTRPVVTALRAPTKKLYVHVRHSLKLPVIADVAPGSNGPVTLTWKVSKPKKTRVSIGGGKPGKTGTGIITITPGKAFKVKIRGVKTGRTALTLTAANGVNIKIKVQVVKKRLAVQGFNVKAKGLKKKKAGKLALKMKIGQTTDLKIKPIPAKQTRAIPKFKAKGAVRVDATGRITALKKGKTKITIKLGKHKRTIRTTIK